MEKFKNLLKEDYKTKSMNNIDIYAWDYSPKINCSYRGACSASVAFDMNVNNDELILTIDQANIVGALHLLCLRAETEVAVLDYIRENYRI